MVRRLDCIAFCSVPVQTEYILNIVACADKFNDFADGVLRRATVVSGSIAFGYVGFASHGNLIGLGGFFGLLTRTMISSIYIKL